MPQAHTVVFSSEIDDIAGDPRTDDYVEVLSDLGYGIVVVDAAKAAELVGTGDWTEL
jgi:hypothetical protein